MKVPITYEWVSIIPHQLRRTLPIVWRILNIRDGYDGSIFVFKWLVSDYPNKCFCFPILFHRVSLNMTSGFFLFIILKFRITANFPELLGRNIDSSEVGDVNRSIGHSTPREKLIFLTKIKNENEILYSLIMCRAVPWLRSLVAGLSPRRPVFAPG
jgi:hypothetical protein